MSKEYTINDIESLSFAEGVRQKIPMYLGSNDTEGIYQAFKEVVNNSTDEALMGYGNVIKISVNEEENYVAIVDEGRGIPFGKREDGENVLISIFSKAHTGGKFNNKNYTVSSGINGIGIKATCLSSEKFEAQVWRDGRTATVYFEKGKLISYKEDVSKTKKHGTYIRFKPDKEVFKNMDNGFSYQRICDEIESISFLNSNIKFIVRDVVLEVEKEFYSENGVADLLLSKVKKPLMKQPIICKAKDRTDELEIAFMYASNKEESYVFVNGLMCPEGGSPITGLISAITSFFNKLFRGDLDSALLRKGLVYAVNCKVAEPSFANQTKSKVNNPNLRTLAAQAMKEGLEQFSYSNEFKDILELLSNVQKAEKAANKMRDSILNKTKEIQKIQKNKLAFIDRLKDSEYLGENSILLCVEGLSPSSMIAKARDYSKYGLLALRGKPLNCLSNTPDRYLNNEEIKLILYAMGIDLNNYNAKKLRYGKLGICVDADDDGFHIALLILAALQELCPQLIKEDRVCWLHAPLFVETLKDGTRKFYYTDEERNKANITGHLLRMKG